MYEASGAKTRQAPHLKKREPKIRMSHATLKML